jgi:DNA-binding PadR family transcriptional regulator
MESRELLAGEYAVLGLLAIRPMYGYEMARYFDRDDLIAVCPIEQSLLYTYLRNIEGRGLVSWAEERVGNRPPRKRFELTAEGALLIDGWLRRPVQRMREIRLELLVKLYILGQVDAPAERALLREQVEVCEHYLSGLAESPERDGFPALVQRSKQSAAEATLNWLKEYAWELEQRAATIRPARAR